MSMTYSNKTADVFVYVLIKMKFSLNMNLRKMSLGCYGWLCIVNNMCV